MRFEDHYTFLLLKPSTLRRSGFLWNHTIVDEIIKYTKKFGFQVVSRKNIHISKTDIMRLYKDDIKNVKKESYENARKMFEGYVRTLQKGHCILLLLYHADKDAKELITEIKGHHFNPSKCHHNTIRYIFRNKAWNNFSLEPGKMADTLPDDNVAHAPKNDSEFFPIIKRYMKDEWNGISNRH